MNKFLKYLIKRNTRLIITVDTSISTSEEILMLKSNNIDIIITDHHRPVNNIAEFNLLTVNPKISKKYPNTNSIDITIDAPKYPFKTLGTILLLFNLSNNSLLNKIGKSKITAEII